MQISCKKLMFNINERYVKVFKNFIPREEALLLGANIQVLSEPDRREYYRTLGMGGKELLLGPSRFGWDTGKAFHKAALFAYNLFKNRYNLDDKFTLDRVFGNIMQEGAYLNEHEDYSYGEDDEHDPTKKTLVCGLFLSDDYEGGEFTFPDNNLVVSPEAGSLVLFTGHSTRHGVNIVTKNTRINVLYMFYYST